MTGVKVKTCTKCNYEENEIIPAAGHAFGDDKKCTVCGFDNSDLPGTFIIDEKGDKVYFTKGNLRVTYDGSNYIWSFAEHQYDYIGNAACNTTIANQAKGEVVDLFGWSTDGANINFGINTLTKKDEHPGKLRGWGEKIDDGDTYRALTAEEWIYVL